METPDFEYTGSNPEASIKFFQDIGPGDGGQWVLHELCSEQEKYSTAGITGFKWKPHLSIHSPAALAGLDLISRARDPSIKVIRLRRNLLNVYLSTVKHLSHDKVPAYCAIGDNRCLHHHYETGTNMTLSMRNMLNWLEKNTQMEDSVDKLLLDLGVPHVQVSYEQLYQRDDAEEWMKIFRFLGVGPGMGLTTQQVDAAMAYVQTSSPHLRDVILNYQEVKSALGGTDYESLLHC
jgi:hypothetical protein